MCRTFIPLLTPGTGRIVNVSSVASKLVPYSAAVQSRFRGPDLSFEGLESLAQEFQVTRLPHPVHLPHPTDSTRPLSATRPSRPTDLSPPVALTTSVKRV